VRADRMLRITAAKSCLAACLLGLFPVPAEAQESIRVVEAVRASTGERIRYVIRDLDSREIRTLQSALRDAGYVGIGWTGRLDDGTLRGLARFQRERGLVECGCVSYETIVALGLRPEVVATVSAETNGTTGASAAGETYASGSGLRSGILYPVGIPIYVPGPPPCEEDPCDDGPGEGGEGGKGDMPARDDSWIVLEDAPPVPDARVPARGGTGSVASPPGIRPSLPADGRAPSTGSPR
jgi:hypothetical protein